MALIDYLDERREAIEAQIKALKAELAEIRIAEAALRGEPEAKRAIVVAPGTIIRTGTIKDWVLKALNAFEAGLETDAVIEAIRKMGGPIVERSSMTPQLSRLKAAGLIEYNGRNWRLPISQPPEKDEAPDGETSDASEDDVDDIA